MKLSIVLVLLTPRCPCNSGEPFGQLDAETYCWFIFREFPEDHSTAEMSEWVPVCETEGAQPVEIETDDDGTMPLASIIAHFPGTTTLKFRAPVKNSSSNLAA